MSHRVAVYRTAHFNAAHRLHVPSWSDEQNKQFFGLCNNAHYHGHNYDLEVSGFGDRIFDRYEVGKAVHRRGSD
jgi:6-pyruvoyltetrahydropterin/6-carboxytetrahydropterin synthase